MADSTIRKQILDIDQDTYIKQAINEIFSTYAQNVSVDSKQKSLLKYGGRITVGTEWETLMSTQGTELEETLLATNGITTMVSDNAADTEQIKIEYHTIAGGVLTFGIQTPTLTGTTPVTLPTACGRTSRMFNNNGVPLLGNIYLYEGGTRTDANTHLFIPAGEQQTQKAATSISGADYYLINSMYVSVLAKVAKYVEARLEIRKTGNGYWLPITQTISATDNSGTIGLDFKEFKIVPPNHDVRLAVRTNTGAVELAGGFSGLLATII